MRYRHYKGGIYVLVCEATLEADRTPVIVYQDALGAVWVRPREAFFDRVTFEGRAQARFAPLDELPGTASDTVSGVAPEAAPGMVADRSPGIA